jgi:uncharacterized Tic20 family protein
MEESKIDNAEIVGGNPPLQESPVTRNNNTNLELSKLFYFFGLLLMILAYLGPFLYFKYYKKKNFMPGGSINVKHAI